MKKQLIASLILSTLTGAAFALPGDEQPPLTELQHISAPSTVAEGGADRLIDSHNVAEGGADRLNDSSTVAEGGADRLTESHLVAENGSERVGRQTA
jgi:hypothetical protein